MTPQPAVIKSVDISASPNEVWRALTEPDKIKQWLVRRRSQPGSLEVTLSSAAS